MIPARKLNCQPIQVTLDPSSDLRQLMGMLVIWHTILNKVAIIGMISSSMKKGNRQRTKHQRVGPISCDERNEASSPPSGTTTMQWRWPRRVWRSKSRFHHWSWTPPGPARLGEEQCAYGPISRQAKNLTWCSCGLSGILHLSLRPQTLESTTSLGGRESLNAMPSLPTDTPAVYSCWASAIVPGI